MSSTTNGTDAERRILVVVPAHNEDECIRQTLKEIHAAVPEASVVVVDDGSRDATAARARAAGVDVLALSFNLGVGGAMRAGYKYAQASGFDTVVQVDADGQHDPYEIPALLAELGQGPERDSLRADVVIGARFAGKGDYDVRGPRRWAMGALAAFLSRMAQTELTDTTSGFRAANRQAIALYRAPAGSGGPAYSARTAGTCVGSTSAGRWTSGAASAATSSTSARTRSASTPTHCR